MLRKFTLVFILLALFCGLPVRGQSPSDDEFRSKLQDSLYASQNGIFNRKATISDVMRHLDLSRSVPIGEQIVYHPEGYGVLGQPDVDAFLHQISVDGTSKSPFLLFPTNSVFSSIFGGGPSEFVMVNEDNSGHLKMDGQGVKGADKGLRWFRSTIEGGESQLEWLVEPFFDTAAHRMYWVMKLQNGNDSSYIAGAVVAGRTHNLVLRHFMLGDSSKEEALEKIKSAADGVEFLPGSQYADFQAGKDDAYTGSCAHLIAFKPESLWSMFWGFLSKHARLLSITAVVISLIGRAISSSSSQTASESEA